MFTRFGYSLLISIGLSQVVYAADFTVEDGQIETTTQTLSDSGDVGIIEELGSIITTGDSVNGVNASNTNQQVINRGLVSTTGDTAIGIDLGSNNQSLINSGLIRTTGAGGIGILTGGQNLSVVNSGSIITDQGQGMRINEGLQVQVQNSGFIQTANNTGISFFDTSNSSIVNSGTLISENGLGIGTNLGENISVTSSGLIQSSDAGIFIDITNGSTVDHSGTINITGNGAGIANFQSTDVEITNSGLVTTQGSAGYGIYNDQGENALIQNSGTVRTSGNTAFGIYNEAADNVTIINSGLIEVTEATTFAVLIGNSSNTHLINSGTIKSSFDTAIRFATPSDSPMMTLQQGSNIQGMVEVQDFALDLNVEKGLNLQLNLADSGEEFGTLDIDAPYVLLNSRSIAALDKTLFAMQVDIAHDLSDTVLDAIDHDCCRKDCGCGLWTKTVGSYRYRRENNELVSFNDKHIGQLLGFDKQCGKATLGLFGGYIYGEGQADGHIEKACFHTYLGGLSFTTSWCDNCVGLTFSGGYVDWDQERMIMANEEEDGVVLGESSASATFITSEFLFSHQMCLPCLKPKFSFALRHSGLYFGNYTEEGFDEDIGIRNRDIDLLSVRLEAAAPFGFYCFCLEPFIGVYGRYMLRGEGIEIEGVRGEFASGSIADVEAVFFGLRGESQVGKQSVCFSLSGDLDYDNSSRFVGSIGLRF